LRGDRFLSEGDLRFFSEGDRRLSIGAFGATRFLDLDLDRSARFSSLRDADRFLDEERFRASDLRFDDSRFRDDERFFEADRRRE